MKPKLLLVSHGNLANEVLQSTKMIVGDVEGAYAIGMTMEEGNEGLEKRVTQLMKQEEPNMPFIIIVDIISGTPCNVSVKMMYTSEEIRVITGLTLGMVVEYALSREQDIDALSALLVNSTLEATKVIRKETTIQAEKDEIEF